MEKVPPKNLYTLLFFNLYPFNVLWLGLGIL